MSDELWDRLEPLLPQRERRFRYPGRKPLPDRDVLCGILYVLHDNASRKVALWQSPKIDPLIV